MSPGSHTSHALRGPILVIGATADAASRLRAALVQAGAAELIDGDCLRLVQQVSGDAPQQVVCYLPRGIDELLLAMAPWQGQPPCAVSVISPAHEASAAQALVAAGVVALGDCLDAAPLATLLQFAQARHEREAALRSELALARAQFDERKWVDRAKGLLMAARSIDEDAAFKLLRGAAMHANVRLAEVSRSVIDAARWAEAVNRAGQLRMLSQRLVALQAQRLVRVDVAKACAAQVQAGQQVQHNLEHLAGLALQGEAAAALATACEAWQTLASALGAGARQKQQERQDRHALALAEPCAEALMLAADRLTDSLQSRGARGALGIVNLCGSQRMRAQRIVKDALLATLLPADDAPARAKRLQHTIDQFSQVQRQIEAAPLTSPDIRAALEATGEAWLVMLRALRAADPAALVHAGEPLLQHLERLTDSVEHSLQVLMS